jgi:hypothetical protein
LFSILQKTRREIVSANGPASPLKKINFAFDFRKTRREKKKDVYYSYM